jgi:hypothetical protein
MGWGSSLPHMPDSFNAAFCGLGILSQYEKLGFYF